MRLPHIGDEDGISGEMTSHIGIIGEFQEGREDWKQYAERLEHFMAANGITDGDRKKAVFLSVIGPKAYKLLASLVAPAKPGEKDYADLVKIMTDHQSPPPSEIVQRFKFHTMVRSPRESIATFVAGLRSVGQHCGFGDALEDMIRDRLVCGVNDDRIQRRLLAERETKLDFKRALELAQGMEMADKNSRELQTHTSAELLTAGSEGVCKVTSGADARLTPCYRCGKSNHQPATCRFKTASCHNCGKVGHLQRVCRNKKRTNKSNDQVRTVQEGIRDSKGHSPVLNQIINVVDRNSPIVVDVELDGRSLSMEVDTGAAVSLISIKTYRALFPDETLQESTASLSTYSGQPLRVLGQREVEVCVSDQRSNLPLIVVEGEGPSLFGRDWLRTIRLNWKNICQIQRKELSAILEQYKEVFQPGLGTLKGYKAKIVVDPNATPRYHKARSVPYAMKKKVEEELERLQKEGIVEPVQFADWAAPIVPVLKSDGKSVEISNRLSTRP